MSREFLYLGAIMATSSLSICKLIFAVTLLFAFQMASAALPKKCIDEILAAKEKNSNLDVPGFLKELSTTVVKTKARLMVPFGKPKDSEVTDIGITVGCIKAFPESPTEVAVAIKDIGVELAKKTVQNTAKDLTKDLAKDVNSVLGANASSGGVPGKGGGAPAKAAAPVAVGPILKKCDFIFNPEKKFCYDGAVYDKCDGMEYNPTTHICSGEVAVRALCNNIQYNPIIQKCENNALLVKCGDSYYNSATHSCYKKSLVVAKCGTNPQAYNPDLYECKPAINANGIFLKTPVQHGGEDYEAVLIGEQIWLAKNLNLNTSGGVCYNNNAGNCAAYGKLFDLETARTACPAGWYLPSDDEWTTLMDYIGGSAAVGKLKSRNFGGTDEYGFTALLGGFGILNSSFAGVGENGYWWSSTESAVESIYGRQANRSNTMNKIILRKNSLSSVRCLQYADAKLRKSNFLVNLTSEPAGATLKFNSLSSNNCSKTPCKVELKEGKYNINFALNSYESADTAIIVTGERYINIKLAPTFGTLNVKSPGYSNSIGWNKQWNLTIDGKPLSFGEYMLFPGNRTVKLTHECYKDIVETVDIKKGQHIEFNAVPKVSLKQSNVVLNATYKGNDVNEPFLVNGVEFGNTPFSGSVPLCSEITFESGYDSEYDEVTQTYKKKIIGVNLIEANLLEGQTFKYTHEKSIFWSTFWGATLNLAGLAFLGVGLYTNGDVKDYYDDYKALGIHNGQSDYNKLWKKQESSKTKRNAYYIVGSVLLVSGIGVHIWL